MKAEEFIKSVNDLRKSKKGQWYWFNGKVDEKSVTIKGFNTWLQIFLVNGISYSGCMDVSVKEFNKVLSRPFLSEDSK